MIARRALLAGAAALAIARPATAGLVMDRLTPVTEFEWRYLADTVMGGVSEGQAVVEDGALRLTGTVSTANRGGFIQVRMALPDGLPAEAEAIHLRVRGNGQRYFIHLRSTRTRLPWQFFQAGFDTGPDWAEVVLPLFAFEANGGRLAGPPRAEEVRSLGLVAYGRDHQADVSLAALGV